MNTPAEVERFQLRMNMFKSMMLKAKVAASSAQASKSMKVETRPLKRSLPSADSVTAMENIETERYLKSNLVEKISNTRDMPRPRKRINRSTRVSKIVDSDLFLFLTFEPPSVVTNQTPFSNIFPNDNIGSGIRSKDFWNDILTMEKEC